MEQMGTHVRHHSQPVIAPSNIRPANHGVQKHRRLSSTGGGRAWTEEEEAYLVRTRMQKMPYKHIATHLHKTELACRLHYHQMSYGSNRRRSRTDSISSAVSSSQEISPEYKPATEVQGSVAPTTPENETSSPPLSVSNSPSQSSRAHVPILPKQRPPFLPPIRSASPEWDAPKRLRLDTSFVQRETETGNSNEIDIARLRGLYDARRESFWGLIASEYSKDAKVTGKKLEEAFLHSTATARNPLTPPASPQSASRTLPQPSMSAPAIHQSPSSHGFSAINRPKLPSISEQPGIKEHCSPMEKCAVSSLLTVEKEVWAPREVSTA